MNIESFWDIFYAPIGWLMQLCYSLVPNYAVALLIFAVILKVVMIPLGVKQQRNSIKQSKMYPYEKALSKKYQIDKINKNPQLQTEAEKVRYQKYNAEKAEIYERVGFNPLSGCLPLLIQLPIVLLIYNVVRSPLRYLCGIPKGIVEKIKEVVVAISDTDKFNAISDVDEITALHAMREDFSRFANIEGLNITLEDIPNFDVFGLDMTLTPQGSPAIYLLIPLITFVVVFASGKLTRMFTYQPPKDESAPSADMSMKIMNIALPLMTVFFTFTIPSIVGIYWIYQNALGVLQQFLMSKVMPVPALTEEEFRAAERVVNGKPANGKKKKAPKDPDRPRVRSLHHIDDDEYNAKVVDDAPANNNKTASPFIEPVRTKDYSDKSKK